MVRCKKCGTDFKVVCPVCYPELPTEDEEKINKALSKAVRAIYYEDSNDYDSALWAIVKALGGYEAVDLLEEDEESAYARYCDED